jgi:glycosyltransferase involved in cell wall biosynthesis
MKDVLLSIVTITRDDPTGLARTLASTADWLVDPVVEQIIVDGSTPPAAVGHPVVRLRQQSPGIAGAFNQGLQAAQGEWVWFLNGGDAVHEALHPGWLLALLAATRADIVTGSLHFDGESAPRPIPHLSYQWPLIACWLMHPATLVRRETLLSAGGFDPRRCMAMDYDLWFRLLRRGAIVDVLSVPFARFDVTGVSERPGTHAAARREEARVVLAHGGRLAWAAVWLGLRIIRRISWAVGRSLPFAIGQKHETR